MRSIQAASIESALQSLSGLKGVEPAITYLDRVQPNIPTFSMRTMRPYDSQFGITAMLICYFVVRAFELEIDQPLSVCKPKTLKNYWEHNQQLFQHGGDGGPGRMFEVMELEDANQRLLQVATRKLLTPMLQKNMGNRDGQASSLMIYFLSKTVIDSLDSITD